MIAMPRTPEEADALWQEAEGALTGLALEISGRCYPEQSTLSIRSTLMSIRRTVLGIDNLLLVLMVWESTRKKIEGELDCE